MIDVREFNETGALGELRAAWHDLLAQTPGASFFHSLDWLECYWKHFAAGQRLRVLGIAEKKQFLGILPLVVRTEATRVGRVRMLTYPLHDWATYYGPIGPNASTTLLAGLRHLQNTPRDWDVLDLRWVAADSTDLGRTERAMAQVGFPPHGQKWDQTALVKLPETWLDYWQSREDKFRKNVDRLHRRMSEAGSLELVRFRPEPMRGSQADPHWDLYSACVTIAQRSWQGSRGDKTNLCHAEVCDFLRDAHAAAAHSGSVDLCLLNFDQEPVAFMYNYRWGDSVYGLRRGYDPRFKRFGPGLVLQKLMLEDGHHRGDRTYDLGAGSHDTKQAWRTGLQASYRFTYFPPLALRAQLLSWNRWFRRQFRGEQDIACSQVT
jgi:CelD/BcsL family acetyltransferase involved in cellulose biosynthesis